MFQPFQKASSTYVIQNMLIQDAFQVWRLNAIRNYSADCACVSDLRGIPPDDLWKIKDADEDILLCSSCRKDLRDYRPEQPESETMESQQSSEKPSGQGSTSQNFEIEASIDVVLGVSPVKRK